MRNMLSFAAVVAMVAGAAVAQEFPTDEFNGQDYDERPMKDTKPVETKAICEFPTGFGLIAETGDMALLDDIKARLAAGETVMIDVEGTDIVGVSPSGQMHVIGVVAGPGGRTIVCYQSF